MNTINFEDLRAVISTLKEEKTNTCTLTNIAERASINAHKTMLYAERNLSIPQEEMDRLYDENNKASDIYCIAVEREERINAVLHAFYQATEMLTDYIVDYGENDD